MNQEEKSLVSQEIQSMLGKGAIKKTCQEQGQFISSIFLVDKKDGGNRPVINLNSLKRCIPYVHFKMEGLHLLKEMLCQGDFMCKLDLKDAYFYFQKVRGNIFDFYGRASLRISLPLFWVIKSPLDFYKTFESSYHSPNKITYKSDCLPGRHVVDGQHKGRIVNGKGLSDISVSKFRVSHQQEKVSSRTCTLSRVLGVIIDSMTMTVKLPMEQVTKLKQQCQSMLTKESVTRDLAKLTERLSSSAVAVFPAPIQYMFLQQQQIKGLLTKHNYEARLVLQTQPNRNCNGGCTI